MATQSTTKSTLLVSQLKMHTAYNEQCSDEAYDNIDATIEDRLGQTIYVMTKNDNYIAVYGNYDDIKDNNEALSALHTLTIDDINNDECESELYNEDDIFVYQIFEDAVYDEYVGQLFLTELKNN